MPMRRPRSIRASTTARSSVSRCCRESERRVFAASPSGAAEIAPSPENGSDDEDRSALRLSSNRCALGHKTLTTKLLATTLLAESRADRLLPRGATSRRGRPPAARLLFQARSSCLLSARGRGEGGKAAFEIGDQVVHILETDVEAHRRAARRPGIGRSDRGAVERDGEAFEAAPGGADAEQAER